VGAGGGERSLESVLRVSTVLAANRHAKGSRAVCVERGRVEERSGTSVHLWLTAKNHDSCEPLMLACMTTCEGESLRGRL
jgi:hypothetical protein